jgi:hypothetical protein
LLTLFFSSFLRWFFEKMSSDLVVVAEGSIVIRYAFRIRRLTVGDAVVGPQLIMSCFVIYKKPVKDSRF